MMNLTPSTSCSINQPQRKSSNQNIQVYVRLRPLNARERSIRSSEVVEVVSPHEIVTRHSFDSKLTKKFTFDRTFGQHSRQVEMYSAVVAPLIDQVLLGYNCTVFAYGQTGTGKTHTMVGTETAELRSSWEDDSDIGIIPRALCHLFDELRLLEVEFSMRISYLELYNEELCDLLSSDDSTKIRIFDDSTKKGSVIIQGLEEIPVHSKDDVYKLLEKGKERRKTATTLMNAQSSRSHTVFSILVHIRENGIDGEEMLKIGKLNLVDLAGSENVTKAGNEKGIRVRETININQSLLTLGRVITALVDRTPHVPYRESKLTRLLQESLGGRTKTCIIATISPGHKDIEETLSTLEYAHRAKYIQNKPEVNQKLTKKTVLKEYTEEIDKLKRDLIATRDKNGIYLATESYNEMTLKMESQNRELNEKMLLLKALKDELHNKEEIFNEVSLNLVEKTEKLKRTEQDLTKTKGALQQTKKILNTTKRLYKEKKVLIQSHVKTEEELSNQAAQIMEVADIATNETHQLHSTIERRKEVDKEIETVCDQFANRMCDNFALMDGNLEQLKEQHKSYSQLLRAELTSSTNKQDKLLIDANDNIIKVNKMCDAAFSSTTEINEKYAKQLSELSAEHQTVLTNLFQELRSKENEVKNEIQSNLSDLLANNKSQKSSIEMMRTTFTQILQRSNTELEKQTSQLVEQLATITKMSQSNVQKLEEMKKEISNQRLITTQEQAVIEECFQRMQSLRQQNTVCSDRMTALNCELEEINQSSITKLNQNVECAQSFLQTRKIDNNDIQQKLDQQANAVVLNLNENDHKCTLLQAQVDHLCEESSKQLESFVVSEQKHYNNMQNISTENATEAKRVRLQNEKLLEDGCIAIKTDQINDIQQLKVHTAVIGGFASSMQGHLNDYEKVFKEQMNNCVTNVSKFKQNDLKTYKSTGTTPSKRDYVYPRVLVSTSPHNQIVKRFRQENDYSDLDTTAPIDEDSEGERSVQDLTEVEPILNSTPVAAADVTPNNQQRTNRSSNALKPPQQFANGSLYHNKSPRKDSSRNNSPVYAMENIF